MRQEMRQAAPQVSGFSEDILLGKDPTEVAADVVPALKDAGIRTVREGRSVAGHWLLGQSLAERNILVQILPVYPGSSTVKVTVQGND
jgi:hypothetical protein